jgi:imidazolonepropionase-like amidohydrolase
MKLGSLCLLALTASLWAQQPPEKPVSAEAARLAPDVQKLIKLSSPVITLSGVRVIDGTGGPPAENQCVVISDTKIESVGSVCPAMGRAGVQQINLAGYTILPGLVGMHDHLFYPMGEGIFSEMAYSFPRLYLANGVTTIRTTGSVEPYTDLELKKEIDAGKVPGPHIDVTGPYLEGPGSFAVQMHALTSPEDARNTVNFWADQGVTSFKAYNFLTRAELGAAIDPAHNRGHKLTGHLCSIGFKEAAALGIDDLEHGLAVDTEFFPGKKPDVCPDPRAAVADVAKIPITDPRLQDLIKDLVAHHVAVTSTLPVFENFFPGRPPLQQRVLDAMATDAKNAYLATRVRISTAKDSPWPAMFKLEMQFERAFVQAGGLLLAGEDPTGIGGDLAGFGDQREVELLVEAGFTPLEAIHIATANGAQFLGRDKEIGTIAAGKNADLIVVKGDPSKNINDIENVEIVFKDGVGFDPQKLLDSVRGHVGQN